MDYKVKKSGDSTIIDGHSTKELESHSTLLDFFNNSPTPKPALLNNLGLFMNRQNLSRILTMNELYKKIINLQGVVMEFGVHWGQNLCLFENFRGMYEPYNHTRKIIGFDTFEGFPVITDKDGEHDGVKVGAYSVTKQYEDYLDKLLALHEQNSPIPHIKKYGLEKGDATVTVQEYLKRHPETVISFAYFDLDIYEPTKACLEAIIPHLTKGAIIAFDELNYEPFPGETVALREVLGTHNYKIHKDVNSIVSYIVFE